MSAEYQRAWHAAHPGKKAEYLARWRAKHPEVAERYNRERLSNLALAHNKCNWDRGAGGIAQLRLIA